MTRLDPSPVIIRMELERMKHSIKTALLDHNEELSNMITNAVEDELTCERVQSEVKRIVAEEFDSAVKEAIHDFFRWGHGKKAITDAVKNSFSIKPEGVEDE